MKVYKFYRIILSTVLIVFNGCNNTEESIDNEISQPISLTTSNVNINDIYLDLEIGGEVSSEDTWHVSIIRDTENYNMPSIVFGLISVALYDDGSSYDDMTALPGDFNENMVSDNQVFQYGGENEILSYDMTVHRVSVSNPDHIYILNFTGDVQGSYKLRFVEYQSGITVLEYNLLPNGWERSLKI